MPYDRTDRFRRAAILVASLDDALAEQVLAGLPAAERDRVLDEAERLEAIDPEEQRDVLAEFRRMTRARDVGAVEAAFSGGGSEDASSTPTGREGSWAATRSDSQEATAKSSGLSDADAAAMADLLAVEHPQIVAAALARLEVDESAAVFAALPAEVQAQALERLADLAPADEGALEDVTSQIELRMSERRERQARAAAGADLVQKILARTPPAHRSFLLARMTNKNAPPQSGPTTTRSKSTAAVTTPRSAPHDPIAQQALNLALAMHRTQVDPEPTILEDRTGEIAQLSDEALVAGIQAADEATVLRALAASGEELLARVAGMLPRKQAKQLRRMLANLGPARLADLHAAQHRLLELAHAAVEESNAERVAA